VLIKDVLFAEEDLWRYNFVGTFDQQIPSPVAFSQDGSMYAVGFENLLSVWSSKQNELKSCLSRPDMAGKIKYVSHMIENPWC
jgi:hypothetical protein